MLCEKDGYYYGISYGNLQFGKTPSLWGVNNIANLEHNINVYLSKRNSSSKFVSYEIVKKSKRTRILVHMICSCGNEFAKTLDDLVYNKYPTCFNCSVVGRGREHRKSDKNRKAIIDAGLEILTDSSSIRDTDWIEVKDNDGYIGFVQPNKIKHKGNGISRFDIRINKKHYIENVNHWAELQGIDVECIGFSDKDYTKQAITCKCGCGNIFDTSIASFQNGKIRCEQCSKSISGYEYSFKKYLDRNGIRYIYQYSLNQCRDVLPLPFDFYLSELNVLVEIDGQGHYRPCNFNHISIEKAMLSFNITKKHDDIKTNFCKENRIKLIRIPYTMFDNGAWIDYFQNSLRSNEP